MSTASGSAEQISYLVETVEGTIPSGTPKMYRAVKATIGQSIETITSQEIRADRMMSDTTIVAGSASGSIDWELSFKTHDDFLEALLSDTWATAGTNGVKAVTDAVFSSTTHTITSALNALPVLEKGQWFTITGAGNAANNNVFKCSDSVAPTAGSITVDTAVRDFTTAASGACNVSSSRLKTSNDALKTFSIQKAHSDVSQNFMMNGAGVNSMTLNFQTGSIMSGSFAFLGRQIARSTSSLFPGGAPSAATTTPLINAVNNTTVLLDGVSMGDSCAESFNLTINTGLRERRCLGSGIGSAGLSVGTYDIKGTLNIYFGASTSAQVYDKMRADQAISFSINCMDSDGKGYAFTFERAKIMSSEVSSGGINTDVMMSLEIAATIGTNTGSMMTIDRLGSIA